MGPPMMSHTLTSGESGDPDQSGDPGKSGDSGEFGDSGESGEFGDSGESGNSGESGESGGSGNSGKSGDSGDIEDFQLGNQKRNIDFLECNVYFQCQLTFLQTSYLQVDMITHKLHIFNQLYQIGLKPQLWYYSSVLHKEN